MKYYFKYYIINQCNYACDYCCRESYKKNFTTCTEQDIDNMVSNLSSVDIDTFDILGGEPSIFKNTEYLINALSKHHSIQRLRIHSNASNMDFFNSIKKYEDKFNNFQLCLSYHPRFDNSHNMVKLHKMFKDVQIIVMLDSRYKENTYKFLDECDKNSCNYRFSMIFEDDKNLNTKYTPLLYIKELLSRGYSKKLIEESMSLVLVKSKFLNKKCYNNIYFVTSDGNLVPDSCHSRFYKKHNIFRTPFTGTDEFIVCNQKQKSCNLCEKHCHD